MQSRPRRRSSENRFHTVSAKGTVEQPGSKVAQKSGLNRSIADAAWGRFVTFLTYKAERAGGQVIRVVKPNNTSNL